MTGEEYVESPFITGMIILALKSWPELVQMRSGALQYLVAKRRPDGLFQFLNDGILPDLDDTALLNYLLQRHYPARCRYRDVASRLSGEMLVDGAFPTWIGECADNPEDEAVSVNVLRFLHVNGIESRPAEEYVRQVFLSRPLGQPTFYYESGLFPLYFTLTLPRVLRNRLLPRESGWARRNLSAHISYCRSPIDQILLLFAAATLNLPERQLGDLAAMVLDWQRPDGTWPSWAAFRAFNYWGSSALTTALAVQALDRFRQSMFGLETIART